MQHSMKLLRKIVRFGVLSQYEICSVSHIVYSRIELCFKTRNIEEKRHEELKTAKRSMAVLLCMNKIFRFCSPRNWVLVKHRDFQAFHTHSEVPNQNTDFTEFKIEFRNHVSCT